jgi:hypothetical protein
MPPFDSHPAPFPDRAAPVARGRRCWPAYLPAAAVILDASWPLRPGSGALGPLWLDLAALACVAWAALGPHRARARDWSTPLDGRIAAGLVLALLHVIATGARGEPMHWFHQVAACGACTYALAARLRRDPLAPDALWPAFALVVVALATFSLAHTTQGTAALAQAASGVDRNWASHHGLVKALLLGSVLCAGRAMEHGAGPLWRVTALTGALVTVLHAATGGLGLGIASLAGLDEPFYFGTSIIAFLLLSGFARMAWQLARERPGEAGRWRAAALCFLLVVALLLFGGTSGGEGVRAITALAGAGAIAASLAPRAARAAPEARADMVAVRPAA